MLSLLSLSFLQTHLAFHQQYNRALILFITMHRLLPTRQNEPRPPSGAAVRSKISETKPSHSSLFITLVSANPCLTKPQKRTHWPAKEPSHALSRHPPGPEFIIVHPIHPVHHRPKPTPPLLPPFHPRPQESQIEAGNSSLFITFITPLGIKPALTKRT